MFISVASSGAGEHVCYHTADGLDGGDNCIFSHKLVACQEMSQPGSIGRSRDPGQAVEGSSFTQHLYER